MITLHDLTFQYPQHAPLFHQFHWQAGRGQRWALLGASGCGKTTLLYLLAGLQRPTSGRIDIDGQPLQRPRPHTGLILQDYGLLPWATVRENVELGLNLRRFYGDDGTHTPRNWAPAQPAAYWLERLGIAGIATQYPAQISGGQRQRVAIARTLILQPNLLLMDEPFSSLDALTREDLHTLTLELCTEHGLTLVLVTHAIEEAVALGTHILLLGAPPNTTPHVIENPQSGQPGWRNSADFMTMCQSIRAQMGGVNA